MSYSEKNRKVMVGMPFFACCYCRPWDWLLILNPLCSLISIPTALKIMKNSRVSISIYSTVCTVGYTGPTGLLIDVKKFHTD